MSTSRRIATAVAALAVTGAVAGCLPGALRPTQSPVAPSPTAIPTPALPTPIPLPTPAPSPTFMLYTVVPGDSLLGLAVRFNTTGRSIAYWSRDLHPSLDPESADYNPNRLEAGWVLRILPGGEWTVPMGPGDSPNPTPTPTPEPSQGSSESPAA